MKDAFTTIKEIALKKLNIRTLETRNKENVFSYELTGESIKEALEAAFKAGCEVGLTLNKGR